MFGGGGGGTDTFISPDQLPFLKNLWGAGQSLYNQLPSAYQTGQQQLGQYLPGMQQAYQGYGDMASGANPAMQALQQRFSGQNPYLQGQIDQLGGDIQRNLTQNILPSIGSGAAMAGSLGGSRQGIAEGMAMQGAQQQFSQGAQNMRFNDYQQQGQALNQYLGMQQQGLGGVMGAGSQLYNLGMSPLMGAFGNLQGLAGIIGNPIMESKSSGGGGGLF
jgi:hypothetical protein